MSFFPRNLVIPTFHTDSRLPPPRHYRAFGGAPPHSSRLTLFGFRSFIGHEVLDGMAAEGCAVDRGGEKKDVPYCEVTNDDRAAAILRGMVKLMHRMQSPVAEAVWCWNVFGVSLLLERLARSRIIR